MKKLILLICTLSTLFISCQTNKIQKTIPEPSSSSIALTFSESWLYIMEGEESLYKSALPVTDIGYFIKAISTYSEVPSVPAKDKYFANSEQRIHIVTSCDSKSQTHLLLNPALPLRNKIINDLIKQAESYDGIQVDWELITAKDKENFHSFLIDLKKKMNGKTLSIAIPARIKKLKEDAYDYDDLSKIADKIIIMAYDEHWSTSKPGAVASLEWCTRICDYATSSIPSDKLVMGLPFYGRTWRDDTDGGKAFKYKTMQNVIADNNVKIKRDEGKISNFKLTKKLTIEGWFDDALSLYTKCEMYSSKNVQNIAFWRLGQEDPYWWQYLKIKKPAEESTGL